jgi:methyl-galactoside transport system substrate-binding protein
MKRILIMLISTVILAGLMGCRNSDDSEKKDSIKVGITMYNEFDPFTEDIRHNIEDNLIKYQEEYGVEITSTVSYAGKSQFLQNDQVQDFIDKGYDVICVNLVDRTDPSVIIEAAKAADIPIIFFNRELVEDDLKRFNKLYYVGAHPEESGKIQGQIVIEAVNDRMDEVDLNHDGVIQYVMLEGEPGHQDAIVRSRVSVDTITGAGIQLERLGDEIANWDRQQAQTKVTSLLAGYPRHIELILANDDNMALGALDALTSYGVQTLPMIVGVNGQEEALDMIQDGLMEGTVLNDSAEKGHIIAKMAVGLGVYGKVPADISLYNNKYYYVPYRKVDRNSYYSQ